jgi:Leucine-rich repeat (LRR) protein
VKSVHLLLDLFDNSLTGSIPSEIGALTRLTALSLYSNSLTGFIPSEIGALTRLTALYLYSNSLTGSIPESLCNQELYASVDETVTCSCCG